MGIRRASAQTSVNASSSAAAAETSNSVTIAPSTATTIAGGGTIMSISNVQIMSDATFTTALDDTAVGTSGGYITINGAGFQSNANVYFNNALVSNTFVSSTKINANVPATASGTYSLYVFNTNQTGAIYTTGVPVSGFPSWTTGSYSAGTLAISVQLLATGDATLTYYIQPGSSLPAGTSLSSSGLLTGTVAGAGVYSFTVIVDDGQGQSTQQAITLTVTIADPYFYTTTLALAPSANAGNTWITDNSTNNFLLTVGGDTKPTGFSPYNAYWSNYFNGSTDYFTWTGTAVGSGAFTVEFWFYNNADYSVNRQPIGVIATSGYNNALDVRIANSTTINVSQYNVANNNFTVPTMASNTWYHVAITRNSSNQLTVFLNGTRSSTGAASISTNFSGLTSAIGRIDPSNVGAWYGYISNVRIVTGTNVYDPTQSTITVPTSPLTAITGTVFLSCQSNRFVDNSTTAAVITSYGTSAVTSVSPFTETDVTTGSGYFDGTADYLTVPDAASLELGSGNFCVELWIYPTTVSGTGTIIDKRSGTYGPLLFWRFGSTLQLYMSSNNSSWDLANGSTVGTVTANQWYHIAIYRVGSTIYTSFNGVVSTVTASGSATPYNNAGNWYIGTGTNGSTDAYTGYVSNMRFVVGSGVYTGSNFTPPTSLLTAISNTSLLTLRYRQGENAHRFIDDSTNKFPIIRNGNATQGTFTPFSPTGWSGYFTGAQTSPSLSFPSNAAYSLGSTSDFTVEMWVYYTGGIGSETALMERFDGTSGPGWIVGKSSGDKFWFATAGTTYPGNTTVVANTWYHVCWMRTGGNSYLFVNGVLDRTAVATSNFTDGTTPLSIGERDSGSQTFPFTGYISNARIVKGTAVYSTSGFTVPIAPLTAITNTTLLILQSNRFIDNSTTAATATVAAASSVQPFSPFAPSVAYSPTTHGGSAYFDGTGDFLQLADSTSWGLTGNYTIEMWLYPTATPVSTTFFQLGSSSNFLIIYLASATKYITTTGSLSITASTALALNSWNHMALVRNGSGTNNTVLYLNGVNVGQATNTTSFTGSASNGVRIGAEFPSNYYFNGYIAGNRIVNGTAVYTTAFTPPTAPPTAIANTVLLLNYTNAGIYDASGKMTFDSIGGAIVTTATSKWNTGSLLLGTTQATGTYLISQPDTVLMPIYTGNFTVEAWVYLTTTSFDYSATAFVANYGNGGANGPLGTYTAWGLGILNGGTGLRLYRYDGTETQYDFTGTINATTWTHIAMCRSGTSLRAFINGTQIGSTATTSLNYAAVGGTNKLYIGIQSGGGGANQYYRFPGNIEDLRVARYARYTANFTAPTSANKLL